MVGASLALGVVGTAALSLLLVGAASHGALPQSLLGSAQNLGHEAEALSVDAADRLVPTVEVLRVVGRVGDDGQRLEGLQVTLRGVASARPLDLSALALRLSDARGDHWLTYGAAAGAATFAATPVRDLEGNWDPAVPRLDKGDLADLALDVGPGGLDHALPPRAAFTLSLVPATGPALDLDLATPPTYASQRLVTLL
ncbi:MAG TPA: hypothetical protein VGR28_08545 [Candidatus Thermoplasmatota archaeon]|jgi:archaellin|nr:hypothetical protein [Candidatus Thermoplasmatota archaeon]